MSEYKIHIIALLNTKEWNTKEENNVNNHYLLFIYVEIGVNVS